MAPLTAPLNRLTEAARALGKHDLSRRVSIKGSQEIVELGETFNQMAQELADAEEQATYQPSKLMKGASGKSCTTCSPTPSATPLQVEPSPSQLASFTSTLRLP